MRLLLSFDQLELGGYVLVRFVQLQILVELHVVPSVDGFLGDLLVAVFDAVVLLFAIGLAFELFARQRHPHAVRRPVVDQLLD